MSRKGQQALEYLVTYGWAFVVVILTIGAFAYFGILNPQQYIPDRCEFGVQLECVDYLLEADEEHPGIVRLQLSNGFGEDLRIHDFSTVEGDGLFCRGEIPSDGACFQGSRPDPVPLPAGATKSFNLSLYDAEQYRLVDGDKRLVPLRVNFSRAEDGAATYVVVGEVFSQAQLLTEAERRAFN